MRQPVAEKRPGASEREHRGLPMMNTTLRTMMGFLALCLLLAAGCEPLIGSKGKTEEPAPAAAVAPADRPNFPGGCLFVTLDGNQTQESQKENNEQIWAGGEISATPTLMFTVDEDALGPWKSVSLVIQPVQDGQVIEGDVYQYAGERKLIPGESIPLDTFMHIKDNKLETGVKALPAGAYRIGLQVQGQTHWDRQRIDTQVK